MTLSWVTVGTEPHCKANGVTLKISHIYPTAAHYRTLLLLTDRGWATLQSVVVEDRHEKTKRDENAVVAELKTYAEYLYGDNPDACGYAPA